VPLIRSRELLTEPVGHFGALRFQVAIEMRGLNKVTGVVLRSLLSTAIIEDTVLDVLERSSRGVFFPFFAVFEFWKLAAEECQHRDGIKLEIVDHIIVFRKDIHALGV